MYFKKVELIGFKSFPEKTEINFEPGITAIIGPNGCGKTNISDAIRWVLGETSTRSLRGQRMEDFIFNGTEVHKPLSMAEVSLTLNNEDKIIPIEYSEVRVTRRCYRSGESEYFINKNPCRLRDIQELFMDTGIGTESYSIMEQGKVDLILSSKPEDRRFVLEEAAGIAKYNARKEASLRKLELTNQNLLRIDDIIAEVKREIISIKRQATKAEKYKENYERLKRLETVVGLRKYSAVKDEIRTLDEEISQLREETERLNSEVAQEESKEEVLHLQVIDIEKAISSTRDKFLVSTDKVSEIENKIAAIKERMEHLEARSERARQEVTSIQEKICDIQKRIEADENEERELYEKIKGEETSLEEKEKTFLAVKNLAIEKEKELEECKNEFLERAREIVSLNNDIERINITLADTAKRYAKLIEVKQKNENGERELISKIEGIKREIFERNSFISQTSEKIKALEADISGLKKSFDETKRNLEESSNKKNALVLRLNLLVEWVKAHENYIHSINAILREIEYNSLIPELIKIETNLSLKTRREEIERLEREIKEIPEIIESSTKKIEEANTQRERLEQEKERLLTILKREEISIETEKRSCEVNEEGLRRFREEKEDISLELDELEDEKKRLESTLEKKKEVILKLEKNRDELKERVDTVTEELCSLKNSLEQAREIKEKARFTFAGLHEKRTGMELHLKALRERASEYCENKVRLEEEIRRANSEYRDIRDILNSLYEQRETLLKEKVFLKQELERLEVERKKTDTIFREEEERIRRERAAFNSKLEQLHKLEISRAQKDAMLGSLKERVMNLYHVDLDNITEENIQMEEIVNEEEIEREIEELRQKLESMGQVNLMAIEENRELEERFSLLKKEREDIIKAREELHQVISRINHTCRQKFSETLEKVREEFCKIFRLLFNGGKADLILQEGDILESGIDIVARPPGKNLSTINQLSGGEKALTAIALLFALFRIRPSPFCILDEIDAPLDDSSIGRFGSLLKEFLKTTQFIIITHNKKTISLAQVIYGITMEEPGISKIVSVKFKDSHIPATTSI